MNDAGMEFFIENFLMKGKCSRKSFPCLAPPLDKDFPIAGKGIELYTTGERNVRSIRNGIHQLMFASGSMLVRAFTDPRSMVEIMAKRGIDIAGRGFHSLVCPILVTSAELRFLKERTVEEIERSEKLEHISESERTVVFSTPKPPLYVESYIRETIAKETISMLQLSQTIPKDRAVIHRVRNYLLEYSLLYPSRYYIVDYQNIHDFIQKYILFASALLAFGHKRGNG